MRVQGQPGRAANEGQNRAVLAVSVVCRADSLQRRQQPRPYPGSEGVDASQACTATRSQFRAWSLLQMRRWGGHGQGWSQVRTVSITTRQH